MGARRPDAQVPRPCQARLPRACTATSTQVPRGVVADHDATSSVNAKPGSHHGEVQGDVGPRGEGAVGADHASYRMRRGTRDA